MWARPASVTVELARLSFARFFSPARLARSASAAVTPDRLSSTMSEHGLSSAKTDASGFFRSRKFTYRQLRPAARGSAETPRLVSSSYAFNSSGEGCGPAPDSFGSVFSGGFGAGATIGVDLGSGGFGAGVACAAGF